ncbi:MAG: ankyrin repeat domain-containing protein [Blastocatellia bacterium]|nr:ankyrin repeat domain-containing protein [Blastocatellia bacterium]
MRELLLVTFLVLTVLLLACQDQKYKKIEMFVAEASAGNNGAVRRIANSGIKIDAKNNQGRTALIAATISGQTEIVRYLLNKGANVEISDDVLRPIYDSRNPLMPPKYDWFPNRTALSYATEQDNRQIVTLLLSRGAKVSQDVWQVALKNQRLELVKLFLSRGSVADPESLITAIFRGYDEIVDLMLEKTDINESLRTAVRNGQIDIVKILLGKRADIDSKDLFGITPLIYSVLYNRPVIAKLLLEKGAIPDLKTSFRWKKCATTIRSGSYTPEDLKKCSSPLINSGITALTIAAARKNLEIATYLLEAGADTNIYDEDGWTPLMEAASNSAIITEAMIKKGAEVNVVAHGGLTPVMIATRQTYQDSFDTIKLLLEAGAKVDAQNKTGVTALMFAAGAAASNKVGLLLSRGANVNLQDKNGLTALMYASMASHSNFKRIETVKFLINKKADLSIKDKNGKDVLEYAKAYKQDAILELLSSMVK